MKFSKHNFCVASSIAYTTKYDLFEMKMLSVFNLDQCGLRERKENCALLGMCPKNLISAHRSAHYFDRLADLSREFAQSPSHLLFSKFTSVVGFRIQTVN